MNRLISPILDQSRSPGPTVGPLGALQPRYLGKGHIISTTVSFLMFENHLQTVAEG